MNEAQENELRLEALLEGAKDAVPSEERYQVKMQAQRCRKEEDGRLRLFATLSGSRDASERSHNEFTNHRWWQALE